MSIEMASRFQNEFDDVELVVKIKCVKHYVPELIAMLKQIEIDGMIGHSEWVAIYADGDGSMRPKFTIEGPDDVINAAAVARPIRRDITAMCYDAG